MPYTDDYSREELLEVVTNFRRKNMELEDDVNRLSEKNRGLIVSLKLQRAKRYVAEGMLDLMDLPVELEEQLRSDAIEMCKKSPIHSDIVEFFDEVKDGQ